MPELPVEELAAMIDGYKAVNVKNKTTLEAMKRGLAYIRKGNRPIFSCFSSVEEDEDGSYPISPERMIVFMYGSDDMGCEWLIEALDCELHSGSSMPEIIKGQILLRPDTKKTIPRDTYMDDFLSWLNEFIIALQEYE